MKRALVPAALLAGLLLPGSAAAAYEHHTLTAPDAVKRDCSRSAADGSAGVAHRSWTSPAEGYLNVRLSGGLSADWDLGVFSAAKRQTFTSNAFGSNEQATLWVERGERLRIQACRRSGARQSIPLAVDLTEMEIPEASVEAVTIEQVSIIGPADIERLYDLGLDVTHAVGPGTVDVVAYSDSERAALDRAGFAHTTADADLVATDARARDRERRAAGGGASALPSGRTGYRTYPEYTADMKALAEAYPTHVKPLVIGQSFEGRTIQGLEIAGDVSADDGRPVYLNMGAHHAREWPSAEFPMEFAITLAEGYGAKHRITELLDTMRVVIIPVVNVDGFIASRSFGTAANDDDDESTLPQAVAGQGAYIRKNCRPTLGDAAVPCAARTGSGVDTNRNYGAYWGGEGSSSNPSSQGYRGTAPFSEPETEAMRKFMSARNPLINITNHTYTDEGQWLREPGFAEDEITDPDGDGVHETPDESVHKKIGDAMAAVTGWESNKSIILGNITGATEDWNYYVQSAYGFTPEGRGPNFHGTYANAVVAEYDGDATHAGLGVREAFLRAGEIVAHSDTHAIIEGPAPPGAKLKLIRKFDTPVNSGDPFPDRLEVKMTVPEDGAYEWHVGPSSRPLFEGEAYKMTCKRTGSDRRFTTEVVINRGQRKTVDWAGDSCGAADDFIPGTGPSCRGERATIVGTRRSERIKGTRGDDVIVARGGMDRIRAGGGDDVVCSGGGGDVSRGNGGDDTIVGGKGEDRLAGGRGNDLLLGNQGSDKLGGGRDTDVCLPGKGKRDRVRRCERPA